LSNLLKSSRVTPGADTRLIDSMKKLLHDPNLSALHVVNNDYASETLVEAKQILSDAEVLAEKKIRSTVEQIDGMREQARIEIETWWEERRREDEQILQSAREQGYVEGLEEGRSVGREHALTEAETMLIQAKDMIEQAFETKQQIVAEAEPFLIELSTSIAMKILEAELKTHPDQVLGIVKKALSRPREQETLTLSVHPQHFSIVQSLREELLRWMDRQAELKILPDPTIDIGGCVIRSALGTIDARIDTQLDEVKKGLLEMVGSFDDVPQ
jgi:flagellar assembly protein FliH